MATDRLAGAPSGGDHGRAAAWLLGATLAAAILFRLWLAAATQFPINDGALFYEFVRATAESFPALPPRVGYNGFSLPFAYPPLSFWIGALLTKLGLAPLTVVHVLPILMNVVYLLLIALLLLKGGRSRLFAALVLIFFCLRLRSFEWLVMGGGLSRGLGSIFLIAALLAVSVPRPDKKDGIPLWRMVLGGVFVAGAILSHLEWGVLAAASLVLSRALGARSFKEFVVQCMAAGLTALALVLPWILFIYQLHGLEPFFAASGTSSWNLLTSIVNLVKLGLPALANPFILLGGLVLLFRRDLFWFGFILLCVFLTPRHAPTPLALPLAIFAAQGVLTAYGIAVHFLRTPKAALVGVVAAIVAVIGVNLYRDYRGADGLFRPLPLETRQAMAWVAERHRGQTFAVVTKAPWYYDASAEWFPTLAQARSTTTVQGREWLPDQAFGQTQTLGNRLKDSASCPELLQRMRPFRDSEFVWAETMQHCFVAPDFVPVFRNERLTIFRAASRGRGAL